jgi:hypothetical protein
MLEQSLAGQDVSLSGQFESTGLYAYNDAIAAQQKLEQEQQFEEEQRLEQERQAAIFNQLDRDKKQGNVNDMMRLLGSAEDLGGQTVTTTTPQDTVNLDYLYDFESIFANPQQENMYMNPFGGGNIGNAGPKKGAAGGKVEDTTDRLIRLIGEK